MASNVGRVGPPQIARLFFALSSVIISIIMWLKRRINGYAAKLCGCLRNEEGA